MIKNDPQGHKQIGAGLVFTLLSIGVLFFSGNGALLQCDTSGICTLERRDIRGKTREEFRWAEVRGITTVDVVQGSSTARRGSASSNIALQLAGNRTVRIFASNVGWNLGNLDYRDLAAQVNAAPPRRLASLSPGGAAPFVSLAVGCIGFLALALARIVPITSDLAPEALAEARRTNLRVFGSALLAGLAGWAAILFAFYQWYGLRW